MVNYTQFGVRRSVANFGASAFLYEPPQGYSAGWSVVYDPRTYAEWDPIDPSSLITLSTGNRVAFRQNVAPSPTPMRATISKTTGRWYFEYSLTGSTVSPALVCGLVTSQHTIANNTNIGDVPRGFSQTVGGTTTGNGFIANTSQADNNPSAATVGTTLCVAVDCSAKKIWVSRDEPVNVGLSPAGTWSHSDAVFPAMQINAPLQTTTVNFGRTAFEYTVPNGYNQGWYTSP